MNFTGTIRTSAIQRLAEIATAALAIAWVCQPPVGISLPVRLTLAGVVVGFPLLLSRWDARRQAESERMAKRYLDTICQLDEQAIGNPQVLETLPKLSVGNPWRVVVRRVGERLLECARRVEEAEHACTSNEVRFRRWEIECRRVKEILDRTPEPVIAINQYDELICANEPARSLFELPAAQDTPANVNTIPCRPLVTMLSETRRRKTATHRVSELEAADRTGQMRWFRVVCRTFIETTDTSGHHGALAILNDISHEKGIQKRHAEFVSAAAHEMKTPLSSIRAYVELLQDEVDDRATQEEFCNVIQTQAERLQRLIENLLNIARIEAGVVKVEKQVMSVNEVLEQAFEVVKPSAEQKSLQLVSDLSPMYLGVHADRDMILQAAINLLSNAVKYTPSEGKVTLRSRMDDGVALFEVEDTGVGLTPEDCDKVFEKFYRVKKDQQMASGTGLGLPLAKHIVEDVHGGTLTVSSELGVGSVFRVTLPAAGHGLDSGGKG